MLKTKMQKKREQRGLATVKPTKKYDEVSNKIRKLLSATAQTFIPELAEALKDDWFPTMHHKDLQNNKGLRDEMRDKILNDWSSESPYSHAKDNIWNDRTILWFLPKWLKNPNKQGESATEHANLMNEAKIAKKIAISEREKQKLQQLVDELPDDVIVPDEGEGNEKAEKEQKFWETAQEIGVAEYGETGKSRRELVGDIMGNAYKLFAALTNNMSPPTPSSDILVDYIRPSREFRKGLMLETDRTKRVYLHNILHYVSVALEDMIEIIDEIEKKQ